MTTTTATRRKIAAQVRYTRRVYGREQAWRLLAMLRRAAR